jgi:hypothetical protein
MDWIFDHFEILALVVLALASWLKRRMDVAGAEREERQAKQDMSEGEDVFGPATGWPQAAPAVPPPLVRHTPPPLVRQVAAPVMAVVPSVHAAILKQQQELEDQLRRIKESKVTTSGGATATRHRVSAAQRHSTTAQPATSGLSASLRRRKDIRRAIIMREILGPPLGLR